MPSTQSYVRCKLTDSTPSKRTRDSSKIPDETARIEILFNHGILRFIVFVMFPSKTKTKKNNQWNHPSQYPAVGLKIVAQF